MRQGFLLAGDVDDEQTFGGVAADDAEVGLAVAGFEEVGFVVAGEGGTGKEDALQQVALGADGSDVGEVGADVATEVVDFMAGDAGASTLGEEFATFGWFAHGDRFFGEVRELTFFGFCSLFGFGVGRMDERLEDFRWGSAEGGAVHAFLLADERGILAEGGGNGAELRGVFDLTGEGKQFFEFDRTDGGKRGREGGELVCAEGGFGKHGGCLNASGSGALRSGEGIEE